MQHGLTIIRSLLATCVIATPCACGDVAQIVSEMRAFLSTQDNDRRVEIVARIESDPAYDRSKVSDWLHRAVSFDALSGGAETVSVELPDGERRRVTLRIPAKYDASRPWPLIYALHGLGGSGAEIISYVEYVLGDEVERYVIAAPTGYEDAAIHGHWPPTLEHPRALAKVRHTVHVDSNRVFLLGCSRGGHAAWTIAVLHADEFAGAVPIAGTFSLVERDGLWPVFLPNLTHTPVLCVWGAGDIYAGDGTELSPEGGIAGLNRGVCALAKSMDLPVVCHEYPDKGHSDVEPPKELLKDVLSKRRVQYALRVQHTFRHIGQASAYWIEGHVWKGEQWTEKLPTVHLRADEDANRPEDVTKALVRTFRGALGELSGTVDGQVIDVRRRKVTDLTIWIGDGMIDWGKPVVVKVSGRKVHEGVLKPNLFVCLAEAARTYDFDRLRWAGLRFRSGHKTELVTGRSAHPESEQKP